MIQERECWTDSNLTFQCIYVESACAFMISVDSSIPPHKPLINALFAKKKGKLGQTKNVWICSFVFYYVFEHMLFFSLPKRKAYFGRTIWWYSMRCSCRSYSKKHFCRGCRQNMQFTPTQLRKRLLARCIECDRPAEEYMDARRTVVPAEVHPWSTPKVKVANEYRVKFTAQRKLGMFYWLSQ